jgi:Rrf2 family protein
VKLSKRTDYGTRAILDLAARYGDGPVQSADIAARQGIPDSYLEQLLTSLRKAGLVRSTRGPHGGHELARTPGEMRLSDVVAALEGPLSVEDAPVDPAKRHVPSSCVVRELWEDVARAATGVLQSASVEELTERLRDRERRVMYYI